MHEEMLMVLNIVTELDTCKTTSYSNMFCICPLVCIDNNRTREQSSIDICCMYKQGLLLSFSMDKALV